MNRSPFLATSGIASPLGFACALWLLFASGTGTVAKAAAPTNAPPRWLSLAEVTNKWANTPLEGVKRAAEGGDLTAQHYLGYCFTEGVRFPQDPQAGVTWYERAGNAGYLPSLNNLGLLHQHGTGVPRDFAKAAGYFRLAADAGLERAQTSLGLLYRKGDGVRRDPVEAMKWFRRAVEQGYAPAMVQVGRLYRFGEGVSQDTQEAERWFTKAAEKDEGLGKLNLGLLYEEMGSPGKAIEFYRQAAARDNYDAMVSIYLCYWDGKGVARDHAEAMRWLRKAAEAANPCAECVLGFQIAQSEWVTEGSQQRLKPGDIPEALKWYRASAAQNWPGGQYLLGMLYLSAIGVEQDDERGLELVRAAADQHHAEAMFQLAEFYAGGFGEPRSERDRPFPLLLEAAEGECEYAYRPLAFRYRYGVGTERDVIEAAHWVCVSANAELAWRGVTFHAKIFQAARGSHQTDPFFAAVALYLRAASQKDAGAYLQIGNMYLTGQNVPKNPAKAWRWYTFASQHGAAGAGAKVAEAEGRLKPDELQEAKRVLPNLVQELDLAAAAARNLGVGSQSQ